MSAALGNGGGHRHPAGVPPDQVMWPHVRRWPSPSAGRACPVPGFGAGRMPRAEESAAPTGEPAKPTGGGMRHIRPDPLPEREAAARLRLRIGRFPHAGVPRNGKSRKKSRSGQRRCGFCRTVFPAAQAPGNHACGLSSPAVNMSRTPLRSENPIFCKWNARTVRFFLQLAGYVWRRAHRLAAAQLLGWRSILATVLDGNVRAALLAEIDENLAGKELTPLDRARFLRAAVPAKRRPSDGCARSPACPGPGSTVTSNSRTASTRRPRRSCASTAVYIRDTGATLAERAAPGQPRARRRADGPRDDLAALSASGRGRTGIAGSCPCNGCGATR